MSEAHIMRAWARARRLYPRSKNFQKTYVKGARAALDGRRIETCPYRSLDGWKAWRTAWQRGFTSISR